MDHKSGPVPGIADAGSTGRKKSRSSLKRTMVFYFLLVALANSFLTLELLWEIRSENYRSRVIARVESIKRGDRPVEDVFRILDRLTNKFIIMVGILVIVSAVILYLFVVQIASPIQYMINTAKKIAQGDLSQTLEIKTKDELSTLANLVNDLTVNLQEIIVQMKRIYADYEEAITLLDARMEIFPELREEFIKEQTILRETLDNMHMINESFTLYQLHRGGINDISTSGRNLLLKLHENQLITAEQMEDVIQAHTDRGGYAGAILLEKGYITLKSLARYIIKSA